MYLHEIRVTYLAKGGGHGPGTVFYRDELKISLVPPLSKKRPITRRSLNAIIH